MTFRASRYFVTTLLILLSVNLTLLNNVALADELTDYKQKIKTSLNTLKQTNKARTWAYTRTTTSGHGDKKETTIEQFNPNNKPLKYWTLISDNGKKPSDNEQDDYQNKQYEKFQQAEEVKKEAKEDQQEQNLIDMIDFDSLKLVKQTETQVHFDFIPNLNKMGEDSKKQLKGLLLFNRQTQHVEILDIQNIADLSPALSVTIKKFAMKFELKAIKQTAEVHGSLSNTPPPIPKVKVTRYALLPNKISINIYGKAAVFSTIDQKTTETYSDYQFVGSE